MQRDCQRLGDHPVGRGLSYRRRWFAGRSERSRGPHGRETVENGGWIVLPSRQRSATVCAPAASASRQRRNRVAGGLGVITSPRTVESIVPYGWGATRTIFLDRRKGFERTKRA